MPNQQTEKVGIDGHFMPGINLVNNKFSPVAVNDALVTSFETAGIVDVISNDTDGDGDQLTLVSASAGTNGTTVISGAKTITYTPNVNFSGTDSFTYIITDGQFQATGTVNVTVNTFCNSYTQTASLPFTGAPSAYTPTPDGTSTRPYLLCSKAQVDALMNDASLWDGENFKVMEDIDLDNAGSNNGMIGTSTQAFTGFFNGNYKTLSSFRFVDNTRSSIGFFARVDSGASIQDVTITTGAYQVDGSADVGIIAGDVNGGTITNVHSAGTLLTTNAASTRVGGLIGSIASASISNCSSSANVTNQGTAYTGGLVGRIWSDGSVSNCTSSGTVDGQNATSSVGGLVGFNQGSISNSSSSSTISGVSSGIGGLVGSSSGFISSSTSTGGVTSTSSAIGGLVGTNTGTITTSHSSSSVFSPANTQIGGLVGYNGMSIEWCTSSGEVKSTTGDWVGGLVGWNAGGGWVKYSSSTASVTADRNVGILVGLNQGYIQNSWVTGGSVEGSRYVGGLVGTNQSSITLSYVILDTTITAANNGLFLGEDSLGGEIDHSFVSGTNYSNVATVFTGTVSKSFSLAHIYGGATAFGGIPNGSWSSGDVYSSASSVNGMTNGVGSSTASLNNVFGTVTADGAANGGGGFIQSFGSSGFLYLNYAYGNVYGKNSQNGGFVGRISAGATIKACASFGNVYNTSTGGTNGGFVGTLDNSYVLQSYSVGNISAPATGGFVGYTTGANALVQNSYARGNLKVTAGKSGGFLGQNAAMDSINYSYTTASLTYQPTAELGAFTGDDTPLGTYNDNYWNTDIGSPLLDANSANVGGITDDNTVNLQSQATYPGTWDFVNIWTMPQGVAAGQGYPQLRLLYPCDAAYVGGAYAGAGTIESPIYICTVAQYNALAATPGDWDKYIVIADDIDFAGAAINVIGNTTTAFSGTLDGRNHTLSNFLINEAGNDNIGVIGYLNGDASGDHVGDGHVWGLRINTATITGRDNVGGMIGRIDTGRAIHNKALLVTVNGENAVGGLVGLANNQWQRQDSNSGRLLDHGSYVQRAYTSGEVIATGNNAGGVLGLNNGHLQLASSIATVNGSGIRGGVLGANSSTGRLSESRAIPVAITGASLNLAGGLIGNNAGIVIHGFSAGSVPGLAASNSGTITESYYDSTLATQTSAGGTGLTTVQAGDLTNMPGMDNGLHWFMHSSYPSLKWE